MTDTIRLYDRRMDDLKKRVQWILDTRKITPYELAQRAGLGDAHIAVILKRGGKRTSAETLYAIAAAADVSLEWLITGKGTPTGTGVSTPPRFRDLPGWPEAVRSARAISPGYPSWVWEVVADARPWLDAPLTSSMVADVARFALSHLAPPASSTN